VCVCVCVCVRAVVKVDQRIRRHYRFWAMKSEYVGPIVRAINFQDFQPMCS